MLNMNIKDNIRGNAVFVYFRDNALWYRTETGMLFPVPIDDIGTAQFLAVERAMLLMRYIRKHIASQTEIASS